MIDPLSLAGLAITVLDGLIKLGERTAELLHDAGAFEDDTTQLHRLVSGESSRTKLLRVLLFSECSIYGGQSLFEQFDVDIQKQIELLFGELKSVLQESCDLLERRYGVKGDDDSHVRPVLVSTSSNISTASTLSPSKSYELPFRRSSPSFPALLRWSLRDKKRVEAIIHTFGDRNDRLHEKIKLWCLASQLGVRTDHLRHLQDDQTSKSLGFDKDATLRLTQRDAQEMKTSLELGDSSWAEYLKPITPVEHQGTFTMFTKGGVAMIHENHSYEGALFKPSPTTNSDDSQLDARTRDKVESLAKLLHQPKEQVFRVLPCTGWKYLPLQRSIAFVFEVQPRPDGAPVSLLRLLFEPERRPELGDKFRLAMGLANSISQLHMVQWVHESFRSENILLFPGPRPTDQSMKRPIKYVNPWILGFMSSRPEPFFSAGQGDFDLAKDIYRHPERQGQPSAMFRKIHDIYALGVVLLEIGLWEPAIKLEKNMFAHASTNYAVQAQLIKHAQRRLESKVGRKYKEIVIKCLTGNFGVENDTKEDLKLQQAFRAQVVDVLETAAKYV